MSAGRPTKYDPAYCDDVIEFMARGYSLEAFCGMIQVARSTLNKWMADHIEFAEAVAIAKPCRTYKLEERLMNGDGKSSARDIFALKNASPDEWRDRREVEHQGRVTIEKIERVIIDPAA